MLNSQISPQWTNLIFYKQTNWVNFLSIEETKKKKGRMCSIYFWPTCKFVQFKEGDVRLSTSLFMFHLISCSPHSLLMFHLISLSPHFIDHVSFLFPSVHSPSHLFHLPQSISFMFTLFGCIHITWSFNLIVSFTFQSIPFLEINDLWVSLDKFLILDRYPLLEADLRCF